MRICPFNNLSFKGYDARPLKALYMQCGRTETQRMIYKELSEIGKSDGFDVFMHTEGGVCSNPNEVKKSRYDLYDYWSQDNKIFINENGVDKLLYSPIISPERSEEVNTLANGVEIPTKETELILEGGNLFIGKKDDGSNYLILGKDSLTVSAQYQFLKKAGVKKLTRDKFASFLRSGYVALGNSIFSELVKITDFYQNQDLWEERTKQIFLKEFNIKEEDLCVVSQPNFHIDLAMRPLKYPYVLVNDTRIGDENLTCLRDKYGKSSEKFIRQFKKEQNALKEFYASPEQTAKELKEKGFIPIFIGGGFGTCKVNFLNAIVNERLSGALSYITNSAECEDKRYEFLQTLFKRELREKCPDIDRIYFIKGGFFKDDENVLMSYLNNFSGGIHCLCAERPYFIKK